MNNPLLGKTIKEIKIADDAQALLFILTDGEIIARTDGDCCSHSWIEHIELPTELPATVLACSDLEMPSEDGYIDPDQYEYISYYGYKIVTDKGDVIIDYRNSSNGYYGGSISFGEEIYGGVFDQNISSENWREIVDGKPAQVAEEVKPDVVDTIPRRIRQDLMTPAELAITVAMGAVENAGCDPLLTEAVILLQAARDKVADFVDGKHKP